MKAVKEQKLYWSESALVSYDSTTRMATIFYACGALYVGEVDRGLKREGVGLFFLPFCGFLFGRFAGDRAEGRCLLKEEDGSCGVYTFSEGVQHGPALTWDAKTGECQRGVCASGVLHCVLFSQSSPAIDDSGDEMKDVLHLAVTFRSKVNNSPLFGIIKSDGVLAIGPVRGGKLNGVGIRFTEGGRVDRGVFADGRPRGSCHRLNTDLSCTFAFLGEGDRSSDELTFSCESRRWQLEGSASRCLPTSDALKVIGEMFIRTGMGLHIPSQRVPFRADPNATLLNAQVLEEKQNRLTDWFVFPVRSDTFEEWIAGVLAPLGVLADIGNATSPHTLRARPVAAKDSCDTRKTTSQRGASTSRLLMCSTTRLFREDVLSTEGGRPLKRCSSRVLEKPNRDLYTGTPRPTTTGLRPTLDLKSVVPALRSLTAGAKAGSPIAFTQRYDKRTITTERAKSYQLESFLRKAASQSSLDTASARADSRPSLRSPLRLCRKSPNNSGTKSQNTEQTVDETIDFSGAERPQGEEASQFLGFYRCSNFRKAGKSGER